MLEVKANEHWEVHSLGKMLIRVKFSFTSELFKLTNGYLVFLILKINKKCKNLFFYMFDDCALCFVILSHSQCMFQELYPYQVHLCPSRIV